MRRAEAAGQVRLGRRRQVRRLARDGYVHQCVVVQAEHAASQQPEKCDVVERIVDHPQRVQNVEDFLLPEEARTGHHVVRDVLGGQLMLIFEAVGHSSEKDRYVARLSGTPFIGGCVPDEFFTVVQHAAYPPCGYGGLGGGCVGGTPYVAAARARGKQDFNGCARRRLLPVGADRRVPVAHQRAEQVIDEGDAGLVRAERDIQAFAVLVAQPAAEAVEYFDLRPSEAVYALLCVPDQEKPARRRRTVRVVAAVKQPLDQGYLQRVGVLAFVDQELGNLVSKGFAGRLVARKEISGMKQQVVEVHQAASALPFGVNLVRVCCQACERRQRLGRLGVDRPGLLCIQRVIVQPGRDFLDAMPDSLCRSLGAPGLIRAQAAGSDLLHAGKRLGRSCRRSFQEASCRVHEVIP